MRGGGRGGGGGGRPTYAAADGAEAAPIPAAARKLVHQLKGIVADYPEAEIYAMLRDCGMDPDVAVDRLLSQDTFHEVRRKRDKKKEIKGTQESRPQAARKSYRGFWVGYDRSGRPQSSFGDPTGSGKGTSKKESGLNSLPNLSIFGSGKTSNPTELITLESNSAISETTIVTSSQPDVKPTIQPPSKVQQGWLGMPGRPSMADIVKRGRPQAKLGSRPVASSHTGTPAAGGSVISGAQKHFSKETKHTVLPLNLNHGTLDDLPNGSAEVHALLKDESPVDVLPTGEGSQVPESSGAPSMNDNPPGSLAPDVDKDSIGKDANLGETQEMHAGINARGLISIGSGSISDKEIEQENRHIISHQNNGLIEKTDDYQPDRHSFEHHQNSNGYVSTITTNFEQLTLHEEEKGQKYSEENPAVIIPDHLQVSNADCAHLTFGSFVSGTLASCFSAKPPNSNVEIATVPDNDSSLDQSDIRNHEFENKETVTPAPDEYVASETSTNVENLDIPSVQQSEVRRADLMDAANRAEYNLPSASGYATSSAVQPDSAAHTYLQDNRQLQNVSPFSNLMQANIPNGLLPPAIPPLTDLDPAFSLLLTNPPLSAIHGTASSSISSTSVSAQENINPGGFSNPQSTQPQPSTSIASGPPLPQHLALHPYAQATLPLGPYASMISYPSLLQSYAYIPPAAFQHPYINNGLFHQTAAAVPNSGIKYPLPQYKSTIALANLPQPASLLSNYIGGFGTANSIPGNFALNQSTEPATTTLGFDGAVLSQYKDGNHLISLQQGENPAMWMHGAGSRAMPPLPANTFYAYQQGQNHQGGFRQGQLPSQFGAALGHSQPGLGPEQRNPSDGNLSAAAQANQLWPNGY